MKAAEFLKLVDRTLTKQQDYFTAKRTGDWNAKRLLIESKELESLCRAVIKEGKLEPDEPTALDFVAVQRPNEPEQKPLFTEGETNETKDR